MSITDAKDIQSWQIGFEDGIKFIMKNYSSFIKIKEDICNCGIPYSVCSICNPVLKATL